MWRLLFRYKILALFVIVLVIVAGAAVYTTPRLEPRRSSNWRVIEAC